MKKSLLLAAMLSIFSSTCFATVPQSELALGSIVPGNSPTHVQNIFGEPTKIKYESGQYADPRMKTFIYGKSFEVQFFETFGLLIKTTANNGIGTPSGIHVGSSIDEVKRSLGKPDKLPPHLRSKKDVLRYIDEPYTRELLVYVKNGKVVKMTLAPAEAY